MNMNVRTPKQQELSVKAPFGVVDVKQQLPATARVDYLDLIGATLQKADGSTYDMTFDSPLRFAPGSHFAQEYHSSDYRLADKRIEASFDTAIGVNLTPDGQSLTAVFNLVAKGEKDEREGHTPVALNFQIYYDGQGVFGSMALPANLPEYINREPIRAARIVALHQHPTIGGFTQVTTEPPVDDVRISNLYRSSNHVMNGGYLIFHADGNLTYMEASEFETLYTPLNNGVQQSLEAASDTDRQSSSEMAAEDRAQDDTPRHLPPHPNLKESMALQH